MSKLPRVVGTAVEAAIVVTAVVAPAVVTFADVGPTVV